MMSKPFLVIIKLGCLADISWFCCCFFIFTSMFFGNFLKFWWKSFFGQKNFGWVFFGPKKSLVKKIWVKKKICRIFFVLNIFLGQKKFGSEIFNWKSYRYRVSKTKYWLCVKSLKSLKNMSFQPIVLHSWLVVIIFYSSLWISNSLSR